MKRLFVVLVMIGFFAVFVTPITAQQEPYVVVRGTTTWDLAKRMYGNALFWRDSIFEPNVQAGSLSRRDLTYRRGRPYVWLAVGQKLVLGSAAAARAPETIQPIPEPIPVNESRGETLSIMDRIPGWLLTALAVALFLILLGVLLNRKLANPETSGPPMREGGLNDELAPDHFRRMASMGTGGGIPPERIHVVNIRRGRGFGYMRVHYRGRERDELKRLNGEVVYQATVEFPDGRQEVMYCLQACANDLTLVGTRYFADRLFRFTPEGASIYVPPQETVARAGATEIRFSEDELTVSQSGQTVSFGAEGWALRQGRDGGIVISSEGRTDVEFRDGRVSGVKLPKVKPESRPARQRKEPDEVPQQ